MGFRAIRETPAGTKHIILLSDGITAPPGGIPKSDSERTQEEVMRARAERALVEDEHDSPHERPWFVSFHASAFPGEPLDACERRLIYRMMNVPAGEAMPPWVTSTGVVGKAGELDIVDAWFQDGRLLSVPEDPAHPERYQLGFVDHKHWLTGSTDLPVLKRGWRKPYIVEVKSKADEVLQEMLTGLRKDGTMAPTLRRPDEAHVRQLKATIGLAHEHDWGEVTLCAACWRIQYADVFQALGCEGRMNPAIPQQYAAETNLQHCYWCGHEQLDDLTFRLEPPDCGEVYYWSRSWPRTTKSFFFTYDPEFMRRGREVLASARHNFIVGKIPPRQPHFQWSIAPCGQCDFRSSCRLDSGLLPRKRKPDPSMIVDELAKSNAVAHARSLRPHYDFERVRDRVFREWS